MYFRLMAVIFDLIKTQTSDSIPTSLFVLSDPENMGNAVEIPFFISWIKAEKYVMSFHFRLMAAIFYFRHTQTSDSIPTSLSMLPKTLLSS